MKKGGNNGSAKEIYLQVLKKDNATGAGIGVDDSIFAARIFTARNNDIGGFQ